MSHRQIWEGELVRDCKLGEACPYLAELLIARSELDRLKAKCARLAAALTKARELLIVIRQQVFPGLGLPSKYTVWMHEALTVDNYTALYELLEPTVELIKELRQAVMYDPYTQDERSATPREQLPLVRKADKELARLRAAMGGGK